MSDIRSEAVAAITQEVCEAYDPGGWAEGEQFKGWADDILKVVDDATFSPEAMARAAKALHGVDDLDWSRMNARHRDMLCLEVRIVIAALRGKENQYE